MKGVVLNPLYKPQSKGNPFQANFRPKRLSRIFILHETDPRKARCNFNRWTTRTHSLKITREPGYLVNKAYVGDKFSFPRSCLGWTDFCSSVVFNPTCFTPKSSIAWYTCALHPFSFHVTVLAACCPVETRLIMTAAIVACCLLTSFLLN